MQEYVSISASLLGIVLFGFGFYYRWRSDAQAESLTSVFFSVASVAVIIGSLLSIVQTTPLGWLIVTASMVGTFAIGQEFPGFGRKKNPELNISRHTEAGR